MKKFKNKYLIILSSILFIGCSDIDSLQDDPNRTVNANPELLFTYLQIQAFSQNVSLNGALANRYMTFVDGADQYQYYTWQRGSFADYDNIKQAVAMENEALRTGQDVYRILSVFFKSYFAIQLSQQFGDIPYTEAVSLENGVEKPIYDTQESIYIKVLEDLKLASLELISNDQIISGDVVYGGDKLKWRKLINSFYLRVIISLSEKVGNNDLNLVQRFGEVFNNPSQFPIFETYEDSGFINYVNIGGNRYPLNRSNSLQTAYYMEKTFVDRLVALNDPRLFVMAERTPNAISEGLGVDDFSAYGGLLGSAPFSELALPATEGNASRIKPRYYEDPINEPGILIGYAELQFILAEAAQRGWISSSPDVFYNEGIAASMKFYGITDDVAVKKYINQESVSLTGFNLLERIMIQKHIASFLNTGWNIFYEQRRTGFPEYDVSGGGTGNNGQVPKRFLYPESEINNNNENLKIAISRQFTQGDDINSLIWSIE